MSKEPLTTEEKIDFIYDRLKAEQRAVWIKWGVKWVLLGAALWGVFVYLPTLDTEKLTQSMSERLASIVTPIVTNIVQNTVKETATDPLGTITESGNLKDVVDKGADTLLQLQKQLLK